MIRNLFFIKGGKCYKWIVRKFTTNHWTGKKVFPINGKALRFPVEVDCTFCNNCS